jgi:hypothetical protein
MNTKALIDEEIATLDAKELNIVYQMLKKFRQERQLEKKSSVMFQLQQIQVDGPEDWARNLDQYLHGEQSE